MVNELNEYVRIWESRCYKNCIPDYVDSRIESLGLIPTYRRIAIAILKNDLSLIGIEPKQSKYYSILKRIEIDARHGSVIQLKLFR